MYFNNKEWDDAASKLRRKAQRCPPNFCTGLPDDSVISSSKSTVTDNIIHNYIIKRTSEDDFLNHFVKIIPLVLCRFNLFPITDKFKIIEKRINFFHIVSKKI